MVFNRIIFSALLIGVLVGALLSVMQSVGTTPIIHEAEGFEMAVEAGHDHATHSHDEEAWAPADGGERVFYTVLSNIFAAIGFAAVLLAVMSQLQTQGVTKLTVLKGCLWGVASFIAVFVAPGIGLPPEIPGIEAAAVEHRQFWWLFTVLSAAIGMGIMAFAPIKTKILGVFCIVLPYLVGAPYVDGPEFAHPDPTVVAILTDLHHQFIWASGLTNLFFWLVLGAACAWALNQRVLNGGPDNVDNF